MDGCETLTGQANEGTAVKQFLEKPDETPPPLSEDLDPGYTLIRREKSPFVAAGGRSSRIQVCFDV